MTSLPGMNIPITMQWLFQNGTIISSHGNRSIGSLEAANYTISTSTSSCQIAPSYTRSTTSMTFQPVHNSDGGTYICQASVRVPWMTEQPQGVSGSVDMPVTSKFVDICTTNVILLVKMIIVWSSILFVYFFALLTGDKT